MNGFRAVFEDIVREVRAACLAHYGERLVGLALFGSVGRGTPNPESDIDLLLVAEGLPRGRLPRIDDFTASVETPLEPVLLRARQAGVHTRLSPLLKTPEEVELGGLIYLDMTEDARILHDPRGFLAGRLEALRRRLKELGSRRVWLGDRWYWELKPDLEPGEVFDL